jgi:hypothetical protein
MQQQQQVTLHPDMCASQAQWYKRLPCQQYSAPSKLSSSSNT